jgi:hypothetical protein
MFSVLDETTRRIQQVRASYNWLSLWPPRWFWLYPISAALALLGYFRIRTVLPAAIRPYLLWTPVLGLTSLPATYWLLEKLGWALLPQLQPSRAVLFCHLFCQFTAVVAAALNWRDGRLMRASLWLVFPLSLALYGDVYDLWTLRPALPCYLLALTALGLVAARRWPHPAWAWSASLAAALFCGEVLAARNYTPADSADLQALSSWARQQTPLDAVFLFPDMGRRPEPGVFRARAARAVYVCWKQGGQVNYFPAYAREWWSRWNEVLVPGHAKLNYADLRRRGIDILILQKEEPLEPLPLLHRQGPYRVYALAK